MRPKYTRNNLIGNIGIQSFKLFISKNLGWVFREVHQEDDFGIDGYLDIVSEKGELTGQSLAVQIKCGDSYTAKSTSGGIKYVGEIKHLNYYCNISNPVILIVMSSDGSRGWWEHFQFERVLSGSNQKNWWTEIPKQNILSSKVSQKWKALSGVVHDYENEFENMWRSDKFHNATTNLIVGIDKEIVLNCDTRSLFSWQKILSKTHDMMLNKKSKVEFWFPGWNDDPRELFVIPEVKIFFQKTTLLNFPWLYWYQNDLSWSGYKLLLGCLVELEETEIKNNKFHMKTKQDSLRYWITMLNNSLKSFCEANNIDDIIYREISNLFIEFINSQFKILKQ